MLRVFHGTFVHTPSFGELQILEDAYIGVESGTIVFIEQNKDLILSQYHDLFRRADIIEWHDDQHSKFIVPGFIDLHVHAAQYAFTGTGTDIPLMQWLHKYSYPAELKTINNPTYTNKLYGRLVRRLICNGVTTTQFFGTIDTEACIILANVVKKYGVRALIGKVCQDQYSPENYCETTEESLRSSEVFIQKIQSLNCDLVQPVLTPRFVPNCSPKLLHGLGQLHRKYPNAYIQSHITESLDEIEFVNKLYAGEIEKKDDQTTISDADIFDRHNLLNEKCTMVHAVHCSDADFRLLTARGVAVCHCPLSNAFFAHGSLDVIQLIKKYGLNIGLGTDIAGGYSYSMLQCMRQAVITNRMIHKDDTQNFMDYKHALYLATLGGAKCIHMEDKIGLFQVGMQFDALLLQNNGNIDLFHPEETVQTAFEKFMNLGDDRNISAVWVKGEKINVNSAKL